MTEARGESGAARGSGPLLDSVRGLQSALRNSLTRRVGRPVPRPPAEPEEGQETLSGRYEAASALRALDLLAGEGERDLVVCAGRREACFFFSRAGLRVQLAGEALPSLAEELASRGELDPAQRARLGEVLAAESYPNEQDALLYELELDADRVEAATLELVAETFLRPLLWRTPSFELRARDGTPAGSHSGSQSLGLAAERIPELLTSLRAILQEEGAVFDELHLAALTAHPKDDAIEPGEPSAAAQRLLEEVRGEPGRVAYELSPRRPRHELLLLFRELMDARLVSLRKLEGPRLSESELHELGAQVDRAPSPIARRLDLAAAWREQEYPGRATRHLAQAGRDLLEQERYAESVSAFREAVGLSPQDLEANVGLVAALEAHGDAARAAERSLELARIYVGLGLPRRARRVLQGAPGLEERTEAQLVLLEAAVRLGEPLAVSKHGRTLVQRLRQEGRSAEAVAIAEDVARHVGSEEQERLIGAASGTQRRQAFFYLALVAGGVLLLTSAGASFRAFARASYRDGATQGEALLRARDFAELRRLVDSPALDSGAAERLRARLDALEADAQDLDGAHAAIAWKTAPDAEAALAQLEALRPRTEALAAPLAATKQAIRAQRESARQDAKTLARLNHEDPLQAFQLARRMAQRYANLPELLEEAGLAVRVESQPSGAKVRWRGERRSTPTSVLVPLRGSEELEVTLRGHTPLRRAVTLAELEEPTLRFELEEDLLPPPDEEDGG